MKFISKKDKKLIHDFILKTDWDKFWDKVIEKSSPEIEAYRIARCKSSIRTGYKDE